MADSIGSNDGPPSGLTPILVVADAHAAIDFYSRAFGAVEIARIAAPDGTRLLHGRVKVFALQQVGQRLARLLLAQSRDHGARTDSGVQFDLALSNEDLASRVGSVREVISRTLTRLERDGLFVLGDSLKHGKRRRVMIPDEAALARYAGEEELR